MGITLLAGLGVIVCSQKLLLCVWTSLCTSCIQYALNLINHNFSCFAGLLRIGSQNLPNEGLKTATHIALAKGGLTIEPNISLPL